MADTKKFNIINSSRVLKTLWENPGISRIEISENLNLDRSTITKITKQLSDNNWITIVEKTDSREIMGRKPEGLGINIDLGVILGLEITPRQIIGVVINLQGEILSQVKKNYDPESISLIEVLYDFIDNMFLHISNEHRVLMVGIGIPGIIDPAKGIVHLSNPLFITSELFLGRILEERYDIPIVVDNDAHCCCWGRLVHKKNTSPQNFLLVLGEFRSANILSSEVPSVAVGMGITIRGEVYYGDNNRAGEFQSIDWKDGNWTQFSNSLEEIQNIESNKEQLLSLFTELSRNLSLILNIFDLDNVILAGDFVEYLDVLKPILEKEVNFNWLYKHLVKRSIKIDIFPLGEKTVAFGAASCALMRIFSLPDYTGNEGVMRGTILLKNICR